jgi:CDP-glycerol glycerophosphotransferase (TagB/SpsB family)
MQIDFIADHDLQVQAAESIFEELGQYFDCKWRIGTNLTPSGAEAAVMVGHPGDHPKIKKSGVVMVKHGRSIPSVWHPLETLHSPIDSIKALWRGYSYLFFVPHDLGDIEIYSFEKRRLKTYDIIFAPSLLHYMHAKEQLGRKAIVLQTGWAKYDKMEFSGEYKEVEQHIKRLPYGFTILYAPSFAWSYEWKYLLPLLKNLPCNIIVKNLIFINKGQPLPEGLESEYREHLESAEQMEQFIAGGNPSNVIVAPRELNICCLFPYVNLLISDQSSALMEFVPFGACIETGRNTPDENDVTPTISRISKDVIFLDKTQLCDVFGSMEKVNKFMANNKPKTVSDVGKISTGKLTTYLIRKYLEEVGDRSSPSKKNFFYSLFPRPDTQSIEEKMVIWRDTFLRGED